jgi:hypothetical protein
MEKNFKDKHTFTPKSMAFCGDSLGSFLASGAA